MSAHWAVRVKSGLVGGLDQNGMLHVCENDGSFQVFQSRGQAEGVAAAMRSLGAEVVAVTCSVEAKS